MKRPVLILLTAGSIFALANPHAGGEKQAERKVAAVLRLDEVSAEEHRQALLAAPEIGLDPRTKSSNTLITVLSKAIQDGEDAVITGPDGGRISLKSLAQTDLALNLAPRLMLRRRDLEGLRILLGTHCRLGKETAEDLQALSRKLRVHLEASIPARSGDPRPNPAVLRKKLLQDAEQKDWLRPGAIPALQQLLMAENKPVRLLLVELLAQIKGKRSTEALVQRALFDLHPEVREAALTALRDRPPEEYETWLLEAFRYPWTPVVRHAAESLVALKRRESARLLVSLLDESDPAEPFEMRVGKSKIMVVRELVRVNHLANCMMCHAQSLNRSDLVRGAVPKEGEALPAPVTTPAYYERNSGSFVRADVTYLRQDFSVYQTVEDPGNWPAHQRYDYLVRLRRLTPSEVSAYRKFMSKIEDRPVSDQKRAIFSTLRGLTGKDLGSSVEAWKKHFGISALRTGPRTEGGTGTLAEQVSRLRDELLNAPASRQRELLREYQAAKGVQFTEALAAVIPRLEAGMQGRARAALAARLTRMTDGTLSSKLFDESPEVRAATARACGRKPARSLVPKLIDALKDKQTMVVEAAHESLRELTGQDFGPDKASSPEDQVRAAARWKAWWRKQGE
jgi:HEAT repeat protein